MRAPRAGWLGILATLATCAPTPFELLSFDVADGASVPVNRPLVWEFNRPVAPGSVGSGAFRIVRLEDGSLAPGQFFVEDRRVRFEPQIPLRADLSDAGLIPSSRYRAEVMALPRVRSVRARDGSGLERPAVYEFQTPALSAGNPVFVDPSPQIGPRLTGLSGKKVDWQADAATLRFSESVDPRELAKAEFRLGGPWSRSLHPEEDPLLDFELVENQSRAVVRLTPRGGLPAELEPAGDYWIRLDPRFLRDLGGHALSLEDPEPFLRLRIR